MDAPEREAGNLSFYFPMQKVIMTEYQGITSSQKQISNRRFENVGKEELKKGR